MNQQIQITPNILTNDRDEFLRQINRLKLSFDCIDLDVIRPAFVDNTTLQIPEILELPQVYEFNDIGFHLMVEDYQTDLVLLLNSKLKTKAVRIYVHQEVGLKDYLALKLPKAWQKNISVKAETLLKPIDFYFQFGDVQLMTVPTGFQRAKLDEHILERAEVLKAGNFEGKVSIDGGVNLESAAIIKNYPIDRVSVGSYFAKAQDLQLAKDKLNLGLNL